MDHLSRRATRRQCVQDVGVLGLGLLAGCGRLPRHAQGQQPANVPRIGTLQTGSPESAQLTNAAFRQGLRELGYVEGQNLLIERRSRSMEERSESWAPLAAALVALPVDIIFAAAGPQAADAASWRASSLGRSSYVRIAVSRRLRFVLADGIVRVVRARSDI